MTHFTFNDRGVIILYASFADFRLGIGEPTFSDFASTQPPRFRIKQGAVCVTVVR